MDFALLLSATPNEGAPVLKSLARFDRSRGRAQALAVAAALVIVAMTAGLQALPASSSAAPSASPNRASNRITASSPQAAPATAQVADAAAASAAVLSKAAPGAATASLAQRPSTAASPAPGDSSGEPIEPLVCDGCAPPLTLHGGAVMGTRGRPGVITVTPVYWSPTGSQIDAPYQNLVNTFVQNVAAASGATDNVFSVNNEFSGIQYAITAGRPLAITAPFPKGCTPDPGYTVCVTDGQIQSELLSVIAARNLPVGLGYLYPVFFPKPAQTALPQYSARSGTDFCAYHSSTSTPAGAKVVYAVEPYGNICQNGQAPNGNPAADTQIDTLSHEIVESITDPVSPRAWLDTPGQNENADMCNGNYGPPLGSTNPAQPKISRYTQVINGGRYYIQTNWSNAAWNANHAAGCVQSEAAAKRVVATAGDPPGLNTVVVEASSNAVAPGATASVTATVVDSGDLPVAGDDVTFRVGSVDGEAGECGTLTPPNGTAQTTGADGTAVVSYTASPGGAACEIEVIEGATGQSGAVVVADGSADSSAPTISVTGPQAIVPGEAPTSIGLTVTNPGSQAIPDANLVLTLTGDDTATRGVMANQVTMTVGGTPVALTGDTADGGGLAGDVPLPGGSLAPGAHVSLQLQLSVDPGTILSATTGYALHTQVDLAQASLTTGAMNTRASDGIGMSVQTALAPLLDDVLGVTRGL